MKLRPYQEQGLDMLRNAMRNKFKSIILVAPTGSGKTVVASAMMELTSNGGRSVLFLAHRTQLIKQTSEKLAAFGLTHNIISPQKNVNIIAESNKKQFGQTFINSKSLVSVGTVQTVSRRLDDINKPSLIIIDETHLAISSTYTTILDAFPNAYIIGLTATPKRLDGKPMGDVYDKIEVLATPQQILEMGALVPFRIFSTSQPLDLTGVKKSGGDYRKSELEDRMNKTEIVGDVVEHYKKYALGRPTIGFCVSVAHAEYTAKMFRDSGFKAVAVSANTSEEERQSAIDGLATGEYELVFNCGLYIEGLDQPCISCVILLNPTKSLSRYLQAVGRGSRPAPNKTDCIILDHAGNVVEHGMPYAERDWDLDGKKKKGGSRNTETFSIKTCPKCFYIYESAESCCPNCNFVPPVISRTPQEVAGELIEIKQEAAKQRKQEQRDCKTLQDLIELGKSRGYDYPLQWAERQMAMRTHYRRAGIK